MLFLAFLACTSNTKDSGLYGTEATDDTATDDTATDSNTGTTQNTGDTNVSDDSINEKRDLDTCGTSIGSDVPKPYKSWFTCLGISLKGDAVSIVSVNLPPHASPYYPTTSPNWEAFDDRGGQWHQNPNTLSKQNILMDIPLDPTPVGLTITSDMVDRMAGTSPYEYHAENQGISLDGVQLFTGVAAPGDDIREEEYTFDTYESHPTNVGTYHHHGSNPAALLVLQKKGIVTKTTPGEAEIEFYGVMCDGTVILGCTELDGSTPDKDLDAQNGHVRDLEGPDGTMLFENRYHIHACEALGETLTPEIQYYDDGTCVPPVR